MSLARPTRDFLNQFSYAFSTSHWGDLNLFHPFFPIQFSSPLQSSPNKSMIFIPFIYQFPKLPHPGHYIHLFQTLKVVCELLFEVIFLGGLRSFFPFWILTGPPSSRFRVFSLGSLFVKLCFESSHFNTHNCAAGWHHVLTPKVFANGEIDVTWCGGLVEVRYGSLPHHFVCHIGNFDLSYEYIRRAPPLEIFDLPRPPGTLSRSPVLLDLSLPPQLSPSCVYINLSLFFV